VELAFIFLFCQQPGVLIKGGFMTIKEAIMRILDTEIRLAETLPETCLQKSELVNHIKNIQDLLMLEGLKA